MIEITINSEKFKIGKVKYFNEIKGYGIIKCDDGKEYYFHYKNVEGEGFKTFDEGDKVIFELNHENIVYVKKI